MKLSDIIEKIFTFDLTRRTWIEELEHSYFKGLVFSGAKKKERNFWQATIDCSIAKNGKVEVDVGGRPDGDLLREQMFCEAVINDLNSIFKTFESKFKLVYEEYSAKSMPENWNDEFSLCNISIPENCDKNNEWEIGFFAISVDSYIFVKLKNGKVQGITFEG
jgi:hypothetical protein